MSNLSKAGISECSSHYILKNQIDKDSIVIDVGANKGDFYSLIHKLYQCPCFAIEASPALFKALPQVENLKCYNYAICSTNSLVTFYLSDNNEASSLTQSISEHWGLNQQITVQGITFENWLQKYQMFNKPIDVLKVDIEGAEIDLIESLSSSSLEQIKQIPIEFHDFLLESEDYNHRMKASITKLKSNGFLAVKISSDDWRETLFINQNSYRLGFVQYIRLTLIHKLINSTKRTHSFLHRKFANV